MNQIELDGKWSRYSDLLPTELLLNKVGLAIKLCDQKPEYLIPSIVLSSDGRRVSSVFIVTKDYISECRIEQPGVNFDFVPRKSIVGWRFEAKEQKVELAPENTVTYKTALLTLNHDHSNTSLISFVGETDDAWLNLVNSVFPISSVLRD